MSLPGIPDELADIFAEEASELLDRLSASALHLGEDAVEARWEGQARIRRDLHTLKGSAGTVGLVDAAKQCHELESWLESLDVATPLSPDGLSGLLQELSTLRSSCLADPGAAPEPSTVVRGGRGDDAPVRRAAPVVSSDESVRVGSRKLDALQHSLIELLVARNERAGLDARVAELTSGLTELHARWRTLSAVLQDVQSSLPPRLRRELQTRSGELGLLLKTNVREAGQVSRAATEQARRFGALVEALEHRVRQVRMVPLAGFFESLAGVVAQACKGDVRARLTWDDHGLAADRALVEGLRAPLQHLLRNAVAHGIEPRRERRRRGKPPDGSVHLTARLAGDAIVITVQDDGAGIDRERVVARAAELGMPVGAGAIGDDQLLRLLCSPGFTTRTEVDSTAGRGIGLDAVRDAVHTLRGSMVLQNGGAGTRFVLRVPASLTSTPGLVVAVGPYKLGIAFDVVRRVVRIDRSEVRSLEDSSVLYVDGRPITITSLADLVGALEHAPDGTAARELALLLEVGDSHLAVIVDDVLNDQQMALQPLGRQFEGIPWLSRATVQKDGSVLPVLDPHGLIELARTRRRTTRRTTEAPRLTPPPTRVRTVLVADDSITMRTLQRTILENAGVRVLVAADGLEARDVLRADPDIELLVTDVDMPQMSGLELCRWVRGSQRADLPVLVMTSLGSDEQKRAGLEAGADAYLVKGEFEQSVFLGTVRRLAGWAS